MYVNVTNLTQNESQGAHAESTHKGVNYRSKCGFCHELFVQRSEFNSV